MNLKQLQFVMHVAETRSFSKAAELSFATQPTLSNAISQIEEEFGGRLFTRTTRKVDLTPFGEFMLPHISEVIQSRDELLKAAEAYHNPTHKMLRIGFSPLVDMQRLAPVLAPFQEAHPEVTIFFKECFIDELSNRLDKEQVDFQVIPAGRESEGKSVCNFYKDSLYYLPAADDAHSNHHLSYEIKHLPAAPIILTGGGCGLNDALTKLLNSKGLTLQAYAGQALSYKVIEDWAALGIGAGILPQGKLSPDNHGAFPLFVRKDEPAYLEFNWEWRSDHTPPEHVTEFVKYIRSTVPALVDGQAERLPARHGLES